MKAPEKLYRNHDWPMFPLFVAGVLTLPEDLVIKPVATDDLAASGRINHRNYRLFTPL